MSSSLPPGRPGRLSGTYLAWDDALRGDVMTLAADRPVLTGTFDSLNPRTGEIVATFPIHTPVDVEAAVARARTAATWWRELGWSGRRERLDAWKRLIVHRADELADLVHR